MSDLHMEFVGWNYTPEPNVQYICAGDINSSKYWRDVWTSQHPDLFWIYGNHDWWNQDWHQSQVFQETPEDYKILKKDGLTIAGATMWTYISPNDWFYYCNYMADHKNMVGLTYDKMAAAHDKQKAFLLNSEADIIVSHHCPSFLSVADIFKGDSGNKFFCTELYETILSLRKPPKLWIHGHTHYEFDYMIGETRVVCWPRGYPNEHARYTGYQPKILEI